MIIPTELKMTDGVRIAAPLSLDLITPYVLLEQLDWFEDEIKFVRKVLRPGDNVVDIGANYGVYTLTAAAAVGPSGRVWAFEPASGTAEWLGEGILKNGFQNISLQQCALSKHSGIAHLQISPQSELNALTTDSSGSTEEVRLSTLDECSTQLDWRSIDFLKIDAEGEEGNILLGGTKFFSRYSPLVQFEVKAGQHLQLDLVDRFSEIGYETYRLVPGINVLVPFQPGPQTDGYLLNLFSCKPDRAETLHAAGCLLRRRDLAHTQGAIEPGPPSSLRLLITGARSSDYLRSFAYYRHVRSSRIRLWRMGDMRALDRAIALHGASREPGLSELSRFSALNESYSILGDLATRDPSQACLASLARVAREFGARSVAVDALQKLAKGLLEHRHFSRDEPFLAPAPSFEAIDPGNNFDAWAFSSVLTALEQNASYSSFYTGSSGLPRLNLIAELGFANDEIHRRADLVRRRHAI